MLAAHRIAGFCVARPLDRAASSSQIEIPRMFEPAPSATSPSRHPATQSAARPVSTAVRMSKFLRCILGVLTGEGMRTPPRMRILFRGFHVQLLVRSPQPQFMGLEISVMQVP